MGKVFSGDTKARTHRFCIVASRFNEPIVKSLLDGATKALRAAGAPDEAVDVAWVPGAFELPLAAAAAASTDRYDAIICLAALIRGETPHFEFIGDEVARGIGEVSRTAGLPVIFGVLTTDTPEQAVARAGGTHGNKGAEAADAALSMVNLLPQIEG